MNSSEHMAAVLPDLVKKRRINDYQLLILVLDLVTPFIGKKEPEHFAHVNQRLHKLLDFLEE